MKKQTLPILIFGVLVIFLSIGLTLNPREVPSPLIDKPLTPFEANLVNSENRFNSQQMLGKVWLINVWASWCSSCKQEHKHLLTLANEHNVNIVGLNYKDTNIDAQNWLNQYKNPYQFVVADPQGRIGLNLGVYGTPESFVIDQQGIIRHKHTGPITKAVMNEKMLPLFKKLKSNQVHK
jgi:cytochrome c biogenesis protein CcmG/thiol:disulfide interchange protein DsbE